MIRPRLKRTSELFEAPDGEVYLLRPSSDSDFVLEGLGDSGRALLRDLDGRRSRGALEAEYGRATVSELVTGLADAELLEDAAADDALAADELARYDRQLRYFSDLASAPDTAADHQARLREARVVVLGLGGLGSWTAYGLACCGVGELVLIDGDRVEPSNLNRQVLYRERDLGAPKALTAAQALRAFNSGIAVTSQDRTVGSEAEVAHAIEGASLLVDAADWPAHDIERWVNRACFAAGVPYITMSHFPPVARVGPLYVPGATGCYECQERAYRRSYPLFDQIVEQRRASPSPAATLGPVCGFVGGLVALDVVHQLTGLCEPASLGKVRAFDVRTLELTTEPVVQEPACPVCG
jgi:molybdopterin/thiamine biosynthesis adenylyltransferase